MLRIGKSEIAHGEILTVNQSLKRVEDVSLEDARRVAKGAVATDSSPSSGRSRSAMSQ